MKKLFLWLTLLTLGCAAWATSQQDKPVYYWPSTPRLPAKLKERHILFDGVRLTTHTIYLNGQTVELSYLGKFVILDDNARWNLTLGLPENPAVRWGVTSFRKSDFFPSLNKTAIEGYLQGLTNKNCKILKSPLDESDGSDAIYIYGNEGKGFRYITPEGLMRAEYFMELRGNLWVFTYEAPTALFNSQWENVQIMWARIAFK